jgi:hypothetical protein
MQFLVHVQDDSKWFGPALIIEQHYVAKLLPGMIEDGLHVTLNNSRTRSRLGANQDDSANFSVIRVP